MPFSEVFHIFPDATGGGFFMYVHPNIAPYPVIFNVHHLEKMISSDSTCKANIVAVGIEAGMGRSVDRVAIELISGRDNSSAFSYS